MSSKCSKLCVYYTARGLPRYQIEVRHDGLNKFQMVRGADEYVVLEKARVKMAQWDEMWQRKLLADEKRRATEAARAKRDKHTEMVKARAEQAEELTRAAEQAIAGLENTLQHTLSIDDAIDWDSLLDRRGFPVPGPRKPKLSLCEVSG